MRVSGERPVGSLAEKENHAPDGAVGGVRAGGVEAWSVLQQLQFEDAGGLLGAADPHSHTLTGR